LSDHPVDVGQRTEAIILAALVRRGYRVLTPFGPNQRYDLAIDLGDGFLRAPVQDRSTSARDDHLRGQERQVEHASHVFSYLRERSGPFPRLLPGDSRIYAIPIEEATSSVAALRVAPTANGQAKGIRWAREYELPE